MELRTQQEMYVVGLNKLITVQFMTLMTEQFALNAEQDFTSNKVSLLVLNVQTRLKTVSSATLKEKSVHYVMETL